jgi:DNA adenine methylase
MTSYHGGKIRIGKSIAEVIYDISTDIEENEDFKIKGYCEPFAGMLGVYQHIPKLFEDHKPKLKYLAGDANISTIKMWQAAQTGWKPPVRKISRSEFLKLKGNGKSSPEKGYVGHLYGYMGKYFQPFDGRTTVKQRQRTSEKVMSIADKLKMVDFREGTYTQFSKLRNYIIYADPPYQIQHYYYGESNDRRSFDNSKFWEWCRKMSEYNVVFVSEYNAPKDFTKVWTDKKKGGKEKLYLY